MDVKFQDGRYPQNQHKFIVQDSKVLVLAPYTSSMLEDNHNA